MKLDAAESIYGELGDPLQYPSSLPNRSYLVKDNEAVELNWPQNFLTQLDQIKTVAGQSVNQIFTDANEPQLNDRVVQIAFGANRNLTNLVWKMQNYRVSTTFVVLPGKIVGAEVVACNIGYWGYVYAALALANNTSAARRALRKCVAPVSVLLLSEAQMRAMHESEGVPTKNTCLQTGRAQVSCDVTTWPVRVFGTEILAQLYALPLPYLSFDRNNFVGYTAVASQNSPIPKMTQQQMWHKIIENAAATSGLSAAEQDVQYLVNLLRANKIGVTDAQDAQRNSRANEVYTNLRQHIIDHLSLTLPDGQPDLPTAGLPPRTPSQAWQPCPKLCDLVN